MNYHIMGSVEPLSACLSVRSLYRGISRIEVVKMCAALWVGVFLTITFRAYVDHFTPEVIYNTLNNEHMELTIYQDEAVLHLRQYMPKNSCGGGIVIRRLVRMWSDADRPKGLARDEPRDVAFFKERDVPWTRKGHHDFYLHLHLYGPVQGQGWLFEFERYDSCSIFDDYFPNRPISLPPIPVKIFNAPPPSTLP